MARKGGKIMIKDNKKGYFIEIRTENKTFSGRCYRIEVVNYMIINYQKGYGFSLTTKEFHEDFFYSNEIIEMCVNGVKLKKPKEVFPEFERFMVSNFAAMKIVRTDVIKNNSEEEIKGIGRLAISEKVRQWAKVRKLDTANPKSQLLKGFEELSELSVGVNKQQEEKIVDSMGDIQVVLIILAQQLGIDYEQSLDYAYDQIKDRKGMMIDGTFVKYADLSDENKEVLDNE